MDHQGDGERDAAAGDPLLLPVAMDVAAAAPLAQQLQDRLLLGHPMTMDGSQVERASTLCAQVLVSAQRSARQRGLPFALHAPSDELAAVLGLLGLRAGLLGEEA